MTFSSPLAFGAFTNLFVIGWIAIAVASLLSSTANLRQHLLFVGGRLIPLVLLFAFTVGWLLSRGMPGDITTYDGVLTAFSVPERVLAAWFEILGLALLVARWIVDAANEANTPRVITLVCLVGTFVAAGIGLLLYLTLSFCWQKMLERRQTT